MCQRGALSLVCQSYHRPARSKIPGHECNNTRLPVPGNGRENHEKKQCNQVNHDKDKKSSLLDHYRLYWHSILCNRHWEPYPDSTHSPGYVSSGISVLLPHYTWHLEDPR